MTKTKDTKSISSENLIAEILLEINFLENIGIKAEEKAPSAVILLKIFGILKATINISVI